ncbi:MAG: cobalt-precorrin-5B (C(1))-methyltransferase CbiD [Elainellaceae cyanobacterium]
MSNSDTHDNQQSLPQSSAPRAGYTLPVFACAAAIAALRRLNGEFITSAMSSMYQVAVDLIRPAEVVEIEVEQVARLDERSAIAITRSDPGDNLDLTRHTPIWAWVRVENAQPLSRSQSAQASKKSVELQSQEFITIEGGEGIGRSLSADGQAAIYTYARQLLLENVERYRLPQQRVEVTIILPEGRSLAKRTSNEAFGVVEGLSLLGTSGISQPLSAPGQLAIFREQLHQKAQGSDTLVFCFGENGLNLAQQMGIGDRHLVKTANWVGPMLVEAALLEVSSILLFGYHGKLLKLAGGIFHTHHHVADGRQEILTAACVRAGLPLETLQQILAQDTAEAALQILRTLEEETHIPWVDRVYGELGETVDRRSQTYIYAHSQRAVSVGTLFFDRRRTIIKCSQSGATFLTQVC